MTELTLLEPARAGVEYTIYDSYACTLREFVTAKNEGDETMESIQCTAEEKEVLKNTHIYDPSDPTRHTKESVNLLRDMVEATAELNSNSPPLYHGNLNMDNIVLCVVEGKLKAKFTRLVKKTKNTDYQNLAKVIDHMFGQEKSPEVFDLKTHMYLAPVRNGGVDGVVDDWKKYQKQTRRDFEKDPRTLFKLPIFWLDEQCLTFFMQFNGVVQKCLSHHHYRKDASVKTFLKQLQEINQTDWFDVLNNDVHTMAELIDPDALTAYSRGRTAELLRFIRNTFCHFEERKKDFQVEVGDIPHGFFEFFRFRYPYLLLEAHKLLVSSFAKIQGIVDFSYKFEDFKWELDTDLQE